MNKTGAARKEFEFAEEMQNILGKKKNINPELVLGTNTIHNPLDSDKGDIETMVDHCVINTKKNLNEVEIAAHSRTIGERPLKKRKALTKRQEILVKQTKIKNDFKEKKLNFEKDKFEKFLDIETDKLFERKRRNDLIAERNHLLRERNNLLQELLQCNKNVPDIFEEDIPA